MVWDFVARDFAHLDLSGQTAVARQLSGNKRYMGALHASNGVGLCSQLLTAASIMSLSTPLLTLIAMCRFSFAALGADSEISIMNFLTFSSAFSSFQDMPSPVRMLSKVDVKPVGL